MKHLFVVYLIAFFLVNFLYIEKIAYSATPIEDLRTKTYAPTIEKLGDVNNPTNKTVAKMFLNIVKWFYAIFWIVAVGFVVWAAFTFLFANGDETKIGEAKERLKYAVIAAIIGILAFGIDVIVKNLLGGS